jgi:carbonic anhydrase
MSSHGSATLEIDVPAIEKPQNGVAGLKHWRYDLMAGLQVAMMGIPLSLGIAVASGAPPVCGLISAIIAGFVFPFLGGAYITISGPAAGLAPALMAGMIALGNGDLAVGYPLVLVAISIVGVVQVIASIFNAGRFALFFPISVVEGMLMAIGMLIIIKQIPAFLGYFAPPVKSIPKALLLIPQEIMGMNPVICAIGAVVLFLLFFLTSRKERWVTLIPAPFLVLILAGVTAWLLGLPEKYLIQVPLNVFEHGIVPPHFSEALQRTDLWGEFLILIITLVLIDGTESLATIAAIDKIDPFKRKSNPNVTLRAMGVSNTLSSLAGGLTIIPGGLKSTTNMLAGGRTLWANFYYACFQLIILFFAAALINQIPLSALAGLLMWIGWKLCSHKVFKRIFSVGKEQMVIAMANVVVTLWTSDLLDGMIVGTLTKIALLVKDVVRTSVKDSHAGGVGAAFKELFGNPVIRIGDGRGARDVMTVAANAVLRGTVGEMKNPYKIYLSSATCMNLVKLDAALKKIVVPEGSTANYMLILAGKIYDHTTMEYLHNFQDRAIDAGHTCVLVGMEHFRGLSDHALAYRVSQVPGNLTAFA